MIRFTVNELGLPQYRICKDMSGCYFIQELIENDGFWTFAGHTKTTWINYGFYSAKGIKSVDYYSTLENAGRKVEGLLRNALRRACEKNGLYDEVALCLHIDLDELPVTKRLREEINSEKTN